MSGVRMELRRVESRRRWIEGMLVRAVVQRVRMLVVMFRRSQGFQVRLNLMRVLVLSFVVG